MRGRHMSGWCVYGALSMVGYRSSGLCVGPDGGLGISRKRKGGKGWGER